MSGCLACSIAAKLLSGCAWIERAVRIESTLKRNERPTRSIFAIDARRSSVPEAVRVAAPWNCGFCLSQS